MVQLIIEIFFETGFKIFNTPNGLKDNNKLFLSNKLLEISSPKPLNKTTPTRVLDKEFVIKNKQIIVVL